MPPGICEAAPHTGKETRMIVRPAARRKQISYLIRQVTKMVFLRPSALLRGSVSQQLMRAEHLRIVRLDTVRNPSDVHVGSRVDEPDKPCIVF